MHYAFRESDCKGLSDVVGYVAYRTNAIATSVDS